MNRRSGYGGAALSLLCASVAVASETLPEFSVCIDTEVAYFERDYPPLSQAPLLEGFQNGNFDWVAYCGMLGILRCDLSDDPLGCQRALRVEQDEIQAQILAGLPDPDSVAGRAGQWSDDLYPRVWALAHGQSAGQDCAGMPETLEVWCEAHESAGRLGLAVLAWQVARYVDAAEPAVVSGWASVPPPLRPRQRPAGESR